VQRSKKTRDQKNPTKEVQLVESNRNF